MKIKMAENEAEAIMSKKEDAKLGYEQAKCSDACTSATDIIKMDQK